MKTMQTNTPLKNLDPWKTRPLNFLNGYAQVLFSSNRLAGCIFFLATCLVPSQALAGVLGFFLTNAAARFLGFQQEHIRQGFFAYNGLLTGLAIGLYYRITPAFFVLLAVGAFLCAVLGAACRALFERYLSAPVFSLPFVLATWIVITGARHFDHLAYTLAPFELRLLEGLLPQWLDIFFRSMGAIFFQLNVLSGILATLGVLAYSRQALILAVAGYTGGSVCHQLLGGDPATLSHGLIGFNFILTGIAVGGVWIVPGRAALMLAVAGGALTAVVAAAAHAVLTPLGVPILAFPFVFTAITIIYALKQRIGDGAPATVDVPAPTPESNFRNFRNARDRFVTGAVPAFEPPFGGPWTVTQGFEGEHTHRGLWAHAWDFQITDEQGGFHRNSGADNEDYYTFNMPVFAPGDGKVVTVVNHIEDNAPGRTNSENNWGNTVVIWHYGYVYSAVSHLKKGSIAAREGDPIRRGALIGKAGNSGRSPLPHLHFQAQGSPEVGSTTIPSELMHFVQANGSETYFTHGVPQKGARIRPLEADSRLFDMVSFPLGRTWRFEVELDGRVSEETWEAGIDFAGNRFLTIQGRKDRLDYFSNSRVLLLMNYRGRRHSGLYWFYLAVSRAPMSTDPLVWRDTLSGDLLLGRIGSFLCDLVEPYYPMARLHTRSCLVRTPDGAIDIETRVSGVGSLFSGRDEEIRLTARFQKWRGLTKITAQRGDASLVRIEQKGEI